MDIRVKSYASPAVREAGRRWAEAHHGWSVRFSDHYADCFTRNQVAAMFERRVWLGDDPLARKVAFVAFLPNQSTDVDADVEANLATIQAAYDAFARDRPEAVAAPLADRNYRGTEEADWAEEAWAEEDDDR